MLGAGSYSSHLESGKDKQVRIQVDKWLAAL